MLTKKVQLSDVVSPKPSRSAERVLNGALERAHKDQEAISRKAKALRSV
jgi:hypothetical protein